MTIRVELNPETEARLKAEARAKGSTTGKGSRTTLERGPHWVCFVSGPDEC